MSRVLLSKIRSITLYKDELTKARRLPAIPQLTCIGSPCRLFQPDVVRCYNNGGEGVDVDWTVRCCCYCDSIIITYRVTGDWWVAELASY